MAKKNFKILTTDFNDKNFSWEQYPRPQLKRDSFFSLNGEWDLFLKNKKRTNYLGKIIVPFPPESKLSGIEQTLKKGSKFIYKKSFVLPPNFNKGKILLNFGAVDQIAEIYINDIKASEHIGGYLPFSLDITKSVKLDELNTVCVVVTDNLDKNLPYGKQSKNRGGMWYTAISGIWQTVWLESVPHNYIKSLKITPNIFL